MKKIATMSVTRILSAVIGVTLLTSQASAYEYEMVQSVTATNSGVNIAGTVVPYKEVTLAAQMPGRVEFIGGDIGDKTQENQILVKINDDNLQAQRRAAISKINTAQSALRNAQIQYNRELWSPRHERVSSAPGGMGMPFMFDKFFTDSFADFTGNNDEGLERQANLMAQGAQLNSAQSAVAQSFSGLQSIDTKLRDTQSISPMAGVIIKRMVEVGDTVQPGQPLLAIGRTDFLRVQAEIPARLIPALKLGEFVDTKLDVSPTTFKARVSQIFPVADPGRHTVTVKFDLPQGVPGGPGMYAEVKVPANAVDDNGEAILSISERAIVRRGSLPYVFVMTGDGSVKLRMVRLGRQMGERFIVLSGVEAGEQVMLDPPAGISPARLKNTNTAVAE